MNSITKNATIITGSLIFLGFCRYYFYYQTFGIDIYNYISAPELLLSFLPVIVSNFIPLALLVYLMVVTPEAKYRTKDGKDFTNRVKKSKEKRKPLNLIKHILFTRQLNKKIKFKLFILLLINPLTISFGVLIGMTIQFWIMVSQNKSWTEGEELFYLISFGWLVFIIEPFISSAASDSLIGKRFSQFSLNVTFINYFLILTYFILFSQKIKAWKKLNGELVETVKVTLISNDTLTTTKSFIYIGQTSNYIFFRDKNDSSNFIINTSNIRDLKKSVK
jgi:hypothetical protein